MEETQKRGRNIGVVTVALLALIWGAAGGVVGGYWIAGRQRAQPASIGVPGPVSLQPGAQTTVQVVTSNDAIVQAVQRAGPAVAKVVATTIRERYSPFDLFFGRGPAVQEVPSLGSGFIFQTEGRKLVLTNTHVIQGADKLKVKLADGGELEAKVLGADPETDITVLELLDAPGDLPTVELGDSDDCQVGEWVIAMGNPFGYEQTVTVGVVSAKGLRKVGEGEARDVIQTDAAINSGNSGGPLLDLAGNVIGINFAIFSPTRTSLGIGFAIPINQAKEMMYFLVNGGPWLGFEQFLTHNSPGFARYFDLPTAEGAVIRHTVPQSPAWEAGLRAGDIILAIDGQPFESIPKLRKAILAHRIGDEVQITFQRGEESEEIGVTAGRVPEGYY